MPLSPDGCQWNDQVLLSLTHSQSHANAPEVVAATGVHCGNDSALSKGTWEAGPHAGWAPSGSEQNIPFSLDSQLWIMFFFLPSAPVLLDLVFTPSIQVPLLPSASRPPRQIQELS